MLSILKYNKEIIYKRFYYKFYYLSFFEKPLIEDLIFDIKAKDDISIFLYYYLIQNVFYKKPNIKDLTYKILSGGFKQNLVKIKLNLLNNIFINNFFKIMYMFILNKYFRKNNNFIFINNNLFFFKFLINDLKIFNIRDNLNRIKAYIEVKLIKNKLIKKYYFFNFVKLFGIF